jgi:hydrogenase expression/formation protein HypE
MTDKTITLAHGAGGVRTGRLIRDVILKYFRDPVLRRLEDAAAVHMTGRHVAFTTDAYVVDPIFFPGGDIGRLAVCGTVNDLAVKGAVPRYLSLALIIEEGLAVAVLERILRSAARAAREAGVAVVCGDTKVVPKGKADKIFITTSGIGEIRIRTGREFIRPGDKIILSGTIGDHGIAVLNERLGLGLRSSICSDTAPLNRITEKLFRFSTSLRFMRDPTRGGLSSVLNETLYGSRLGMIISEHKIPVKKAVRGAATMLGLDLLEIANEGKFIAVVDPRKATAVLKVIKSHRRGRGAAIIGEIIRKPAGVWLKTAIGGLRPVILLETESLPRIC